MKGLEDLKDRLAAAGGLMHHLCRLGHELFPVAAGRGVGVLADSVRDTDIGQGVSPPVGEVKVRGMVWTGLKTDYKLVNSYFYDYYD